MLMCLISNLQQHNVKIVVILFQLLQKSGLCCCMMLDFPYFNLSGYMVTFTIIMYKSYSSKSVLLPRYLILLFFTLQDGFALLLELMLGGRISTEYDIQHHGLLSTYLEQISVIPFRPCTVDYDIQPICHQQGIDSTMCNLPSHLFICLLSIVLF